MFTYRQIAMLDDPPSLLAVSHRLFLFALGQVLAELALIEMDPRFQP